MGGDVSDVEEWIDRLAIQDLVVRYSDAATRGDWDAFEAVWAEDAVWEVGPPVDTRVVGARAIRDDVAASLDRAEVLAQMTHGAVVTLLGDGRATSTTTIHALARTGAHHVVNLGVYYDELAKLDGEWRFTRRRLQPVYSDTSPLPGVVPISRAELRELR
jgi:ketosteroid isomerase-like protein